MLSRCGRCTRDMVRFCCRSNGPALTHSSSVGPCIRINPGEVHINDPAYWDVLYANSNKLDKDSWYCGRCFQPVYACVGV